MIPPFEHEQKHGDQKVTVLVEEGQTCSFPGKTMSSEKIEVYSNKKNKCG